MTPLTLAVIAALQCPDGSPPPCGGARPRPAPAAVQPGSIAVLPFVNRSADSTDAYLAEALPEQIAGRLNRVRQLQVKSATQAQAQWRRTPDPAQAARALRVEWYVTGSIRRIGRQLAVNAELVRAASGDGVWSAPFRRSDDDLAAIEEQIAE
jgi:TolB-like protein